MAKQYLYRVAWFGDENGENTETLGFVYAENDEQAFEKWHFEKEAGAFGGRGWNDEAFYTVERMEEEERLRDILDDCPALTKLPDEIKWKLAEAFALNID